MSKTLEIKFKGEKLKFELNEEEAKLFTDDSAFLTKESNDSISISDTFFDDSVQVKDVCRYKLVYESSNWMFKSPKGLNISKFSTENDIEIDDSDENLILILESPHKDEYVIENKKLIPKSPASGDTGKHLYKYFNSHVLPILFSLGLILEQSKKYNFCIVNPVPYQTSLFHINGKGVHKTLRNKIWKKLYPKCSSIFKEKLNSYEPSIILNGCTSDLKKELDNEIKKTCCAKIFNISHPSCWQISLASFKRS